MPYCRNCGIKLDDTSEFCGNCGTPVRRIVEPEVQNDNQQINGTAGNPPDTAEKLQEKAETNTKPKIADPVIPDPVVSEPAVPNPVVPEQTITLNTNNTNESSQPAPAPELKTTGEPLNQKKPYSKGLIVAVIALSISLLIASSLLIVILIKNQNVAGSDNKDLSVVVETTSENSSRERPTESSNNTSAEIILQPSESNYTYVFPDWYEINKVVVYNNMVCLARNNYWGYKDGHLLYIWLFVSDENGYIISAYACLCCYDKDVAQDAYNEMLERGYRAENLYWDKSRNVIVEKNKEKELSIIRNEKGLSSSDKVSVQDVIDYLDGALWGNEPIYEIVYYSSDSDTSSEKSPDEIKDINTLPTSMKMTCVDLDGETFSGLYVFSYDNDKLIKVSLYDDSSLLDELVLEYDAAGNCILDYGVAFGSNRFYIDPYYKYFDDNNYLIKDERADGMYYTIFENDEDGNPIHILHYEATNGTARFYMQDDSTYDEFNRCVSTHRENFGHWTIDYSYYYNGNNSNPYYMEQVANSSDGQEIITTTYTYYYDEFNRMVKKVEEEVYPDNQGSWITTTEYTYD